MTIAMSARDRDVERNIRGALSPRDDCAEGGKSGSCRVKARLSGVRTRVVKKYAGSRILTKRNIIKSLVNKDVSARQIASDIIIPLRVPILIITVHHYFTRDVVRADKIFCLVGGEKNSLENHVGIFCKTLYRLPGKKSFKIRSV